MWLCDQGIDTEGMGSMGSAESTMSVFANRLKNGCAWSDEGKYAFIRFMVGIDIKTLFSTMSYRLVDDKRTNKQPTYYH